MRSRALLVDWLRMRGVPVHQTQVIEVWDIRPSHAEGRDIKEEDEMVWWSGSSSTGKSCATCSWLFWNCDCAVVRMKHFAVRYLKYETESAELTRLSRGCGVVKGGGCTWRGIILLAQHFHISKVGCILLEFQSIIVRQALLTSSLEGYPWSWVVITWFVSLLPLFWKFATPWHWWISSVNPLLWTPPACHLSESIAELCWTAVDRLDISLSFYTHQTFMLLQIVFKQLLSFQSLISTLLCQSPKYENYIHLGC